MTEAVKCSHGVSITLCTIDDCAIGDCVQLQKTGAMSCCRYGGCATAVLQLRITG